MEDIATNAPGTLMSPALQFGAFGLCAALVAVIGFLLRTQREVTASLQASFEENIVRLLQNHRELYDQLMDHHTRREEAHFSAQSQTIERNSQVCAEVAGLLRAVERQLDERARAAVE